MEAAHQNKEIDLDSKAKKQFYDYYFGENEWKRKWGFGEGFL